MNWDFKHRPDRQYHYEAYYSPQGAEMHELYSWCYSTFGTPGNAWDSHGGWIKFRGEEEVTAFLLRWQ